MADGTDDTTPDLPEATVVEDLAADAPRPRRKLALWGALAVLALGAGTIAVNARDDDPPRLPVAFGANGDADAETATPAAADMSMMAWVHYVAGDDLPALGGKADAYKLSGEVDRGDVERVAAALDLDGDIVEEGGIWRLATDDATLEVYPGSGGGWWYSKTFDEPGFGGSAGSSGSAACPPDEKECAVSDLPGTDTPVTTIYEPPPPPADLPSEEEARAIALELFADLGPSVDGAKVTVDGPYEGWYVSIEPTVDGLAQSGMHFNATVGSKGEILNAGGIVNTPERLGSYPTIDTGAAIDRLNEGVAYGTGGREAFAADATAESGSPDTTIAPAPAHEPVTTTILSDVGGGGDASIGSGTTVAPLPVMECEAIDPAATDQATATTVVMDPGTATSSSGCIDPYVPPSEPIEVVLHEADRILVMISASDGSTDAYLVPGYRMRGDDDTTVDVPSVDDESLLPTTKPQADPDTPVGDDPATITTEPATRCAQPEPGPDGAVPDICLDPDSVPPVEPSVGEG